MTNKIHNPVIDGRFDVSIIVPTYNRANYLEECLDSLLGQTEPAYEIIVVNDGSTDNTLEILENYGNKIKCIHKENGGKPSAVNLALDTVRGNLVWLFDDDDVALPDAIEQRINTLKENPDASIVYSPHYLGEDDINGAIKQTKLHKTPNYSGDTFFLELLKGCFFHLASTLVRTEAYRAVGKFDHTLLSSEDYDMQIRLARGFPVAYCKSPSFIFRQHPGLRGSEEIRYAADKRSKIFRKYDGNVGRKIRSQLALHEYLPRAPESDELTNDLTRQAFLSRMLVMASKGCIVEMFEDIALAMDTMDKGNKFIDKEKILISSAITTGYSYEAICDEWPNFIQQVKNIPSNVAGKQATHALAKGFVLLTKSYPGSLKEKYKSLVLALKTRCC